jgi:ABC-2 type transport system permease protein
MSVEKNSGQKKNLSRFLPISLPLWGRIWRDYWYITLMCAGTLFAFHWIVVTFLPNYHMKYRFAIIKQLPSFVKAMIGQDLMDVINLTSIDAFAYMHPISLAVLVAFAVMLPSWVLVGQIDRGTIELVLATPISRKKILGTTILAGIVGGALLIGAMLLGTWVGVKTTRLPEVFLFSRILVCALNLYAMYLVLLSASVLFSAVTSLRGMAVGWAIGCCVGAYLIHFLSEWWKFVEKISFIGPLYYFRPIKIAAGQYDNLPKDIGVLLAISAVLFLIAAVWYSKRDIAVV